MRIIALLALLAVGAVLAACGSGSSYGGRLEVRRLELGQRERGEVRGRLPRGERRRSAAWIVDAQGAHPLPLHRRGAGRPGVHRRLPWLRGLPPPSRAPRTGLPEHVATVKRPDGGRLQLWDDGHPLYRYAGDQSKARTPNGEGVGGQWFVLKAGGDDADGAPSGAKGDYGY